LTLRLKVTQSFKIACITVLEHASHGLSVIAELLVTASLDKDFDVSWLLQDNQSHGSEFLYAH